MDTNEFFRNATLKICGNLVLEEALHTTLLYLRNYLPIDALFAEYFDPGLGAACTIARADVSGGTRLSLITPLPTEAREDRAAFPKLLENPVAGGSCRRSRRRDSQGPQHLFP